MLEDFWYAVTLFGDPAVWGVASGLLVVFSLFMRDTTLRDNKHPRMKAFLDKFVPLLTISLIASFIVFGIKPLLAVERPCVPCTEGFVDCNIYCPGDYSFPSGHATIGFVVFTSLFLSIRRKYSPLLFIPAMLISLSRIMLGVHTWPDVIAGSVIGILATAVVHKALTIFLNKAKKSRK